MGFFPLCLSLPLHLSPSLSLSLSPTHKQKKISLIYSGVHSLHSGVTFSQCNYHTTRFESDLASSCEHFNELSLFLNGNLVCLWCMFDSGALQMSSNLLISLSPSFSSQSVRALFSSSFQQCSPRMTFVMLSLIFNSLFHNIKIPSHYLLWVFSSYLIIIIYVDCFYFLLFSSFPQNRFTAERFCCACRVWSGERHRDKQHSHTFAITIGWIPRTSNHRLIEAIHINQSQGRQ